MNNQTQSPNTNETQPSPWKKSWRGPRAFILWFLSLAGLAFLVTCIAGFFIQFDLTDLLIVSGLPFALAAPLSFAVLLLRSHFSGSKLKKLYFDLLISAFVGLEIISIIWLSSIYRQHHQREHALDLLTLGAIVAFGVLIVVWLTHRHLWKKFTFTAAFLMTLIALAWAEENWRGKRAWDKYKAELIASGERLEWKDYSPAPVSDDENFTKTPFLQAVGFKDKVDTNVLKSFTGYFSGYAHSKLMGTDGELIDLKQWQAELRGDKSFDLPPLPQEPAADILATYKKVEPIMDELRQASLRPSSQFSVSPKPWPDVRVPNFVSCRLIAQAFAGHAVAEIALGNSDMAMRDFYTTHQLATGLLNSDPILVSTMIAVAIDGLNLRTFWEGWAGGQWNDAQMEQFQKIFASVDLLKSLDTSLRGGERNGIIGMVQNTPPEKLFSDNKMKSPFTYMPRGWLYQNIVVYARAMQRMVPIVDGSQQRVFPKIWPDFNSYIEDLCGRRSPFKYLAAIGIPNMNRAAQTAARNQTMINEAMLVCALERFRHAHGQYPETLDALTPQFIEKIPHDVVGGGPLTYRRTDNGRFLLYSIGWNEKDDGGVAGGKKSDGSLDVTQGDWVWLFPTKN